MNTKGLESQEGAVYRYFLKRNGTGARGKTHKGKSSSSICAQPKSLHNLLCYLFTFLRKGHATSHSKQHTTE